MGIIYDDSDIAEMSPITKKLDVFLRGEGFSILEAGRTTGGNNKPVNRLEYMNGDGECVFLHTIEKGQ